MKRQFPNYINILLFIWSFASLLHHYIRRNWLGFWDGYRTELDQVYEMIYPAYIIVFLLFCLAFLYLLVQSSGPRKHLWWVAGLFLLLKLLIVVFNIYLEANFEQGQGG